MTASTKAQTANRAAAKFAKTRREARAGCPNDESAADDKAAVDLPQKGFFIELFRSISESIDGQDD
jgi:hypothetical protein